MNNSKPIIFSLTLLLIACAINGAKYGYGRSGRYVDNKFIDGCRCGDTVDDMLTFVLDRTFEDVDGSPFLLPDINKFTEHFGWEVDGPEFLDFEDDCLDFYTNIGIDFASIDRDVDGVRILMDGDGTPIAQLLPFGNNLDDRYRRVDQCKGQIKHCPVVRDVSWSAFSFIDSIKINIDNKQYDWRTDEILACGMYRIIDKGGEVMDIKFRSSEPIRSPNEDGGSIFRCYLERNGELGQANGMFVNTYDPISRIAEQTARSILTFPAKTKKAHCQEPCECDEKSSTDVY